MRTIDLETAVQEFLSLGQTLLSSQALTAEHVLQAVMPWYRDVHVENAENAPDSDMVLLQWGAIRPMLLPGPVDLRRSEEAPGWDNKKWSYIDVTRQVFAPLSEEDEFDDGALQMSMTLYYAPAIGDEPSGNMWIHTREEIEAGLGRFRDVPFVRSLLLVRGRNATVTVDGV